MLKKILFAGIIFYLFVACNNPKPSYVFIEGFTQGGTFRIKYLPNKDTIPVNEIYSLLNQINASLSLYDSNSIICRINKNDTTVELDRYFLEIFRESYKAYQQTDGAFDITVAPLVRYWGFIPKNNNNNPAAIDSLLQFVGMEKIHLVNNKLVKDNPNVQLDVNGIAQGYTVDKLSMLLESKKVQHYMIEVGGEVKVKGKNPNGQLWKVGIDKPIENSNELNRELQTILQITDISIATSGSYRKFIEKDGIKYSHTINPKTGIPTFHRLLSVTILHSSCTQADALATAIMVMGLEKGISYIKENNLKAYLIFSDEKGHLQTWFSKELEKNIVTVDAKNN
ncbi:MAG: FAD:protein FMN transferase [Bacteroidales bacterium]|nr:FAD:protein FMN transferase [Bacteroidales bacterium]